MIKTCMTIYFILLKLLHNDMPAVNPITDLPVFSSKIVECEKGTSANDMFYS